VPELVELEVGENNRAMNVRFEKNIGMEPPMKLSEFQWKVRCTACQVELASLATQIKPSQTIWWLFSQLGKNGQRKLNIIFPRAYRVLRRFSDASYRLRPVPFYCKR